MCFLRGLLQCVMETKNRNNLIVVFLTCSGMFLQCVAIVVKKLLEGDKITAFVKETGAPNNCFLYNICSEKQILPRIFYYLTTAKNFSMTIHVEFSKLI